MPEIEEPGALVPSSPTSRTGERGIGRSVVSAAPKPSSASASTINFVLSKARLPASDSKKSMRRPAAKGLAAPFGIMTARDSTKV